MVLVLVKVLVMVLVLVLKMPQSRMFQCTDMLFFANGVEIKKFNILTFLSGNCYLNWISYAQQEMTHSGWLYILTLLSATSAHLLFFGLNKFTIPVAAQCSL
jgi:hypothetical protein